MTEAYLHFIWKMKRLPFHQLKTIDDKPLLVYQTGVFNQHESGPDFFNARIALDGIEWAGQIEMHLKSSDWYAHHHDSDQAYNNVVLHVVYEHDSEVFVNGSKIPTVELKDVIDWKHYDFWISFNKSMREIPCENGISQIDFMYVHAMMHRALIERLNRKYGELMYTFSDFSEEAILYVLIARAFGAKVNAIPFELLTNQLPLSVLKRLDKTQRKTSILIASGLFQQEHDEDHFVSNRLHQSIWKRKGLRPASHPEYRVKQFAAFVSNCDFELLSQFVSPLEAKMYIQ